MKLKLHLLSDLHFECYREVPIDKFICHDADILVLAGDILYARNSLRHLERLCEAYKHVIHVMGNHEYWNSEFYSAQKYLAEFEKNNPYENYHFLEKTTFTLNGQRFIGCTLWYNDSPINIQYEEWMRDFQKIYSKDTKFRNFIYPYARNSKAYLKNNVKPDDIVITHMMPSEDCVDFKYRGNPFNCFYYNNCHDILEQNRPKLWLHGHAHSFSDKKIYDTRIVRNPHGYPDETDVGWRKDFIIDLAE
jgi:Icc-related predicted phosphoesterase